MALARRRAFAPLSTFSLKAPPAALVPVAAALALLLTGAPASHAQAVPTAAGTALITWDLPGGDLGDTLSRIARQGQRSLVADPALLQGKRAPAVRGALSVEDAAQGALQGSGLSLARTAAGSLTVVKSVASPAADNHSTSEGEYSLREVRVTGKRDGETEGTGSYTSDAITIGKTAQALREHPQSVSVFTRQRLEDQNITDLSKAAEQIVGITVQDTNSRSQEIFSRGFAIDSIQLDGGAPMSSSYDNYAEMVFDMSEFDRVEVLRGAAGLLNGTGNPGGAVNLVRKMPTATPQFNFTASAGRWNNHRSEVDVSGPLAFDGKLRGRAVLAYENRNYFTDYRATEKPTFYGVLEADLGPSAVLALGAREQHAKENGRSIGLPRYSNGADLNLPRNSGFTTPWAYSDHTSKELFAKLTWRLADRWTLRANATHTQDDGDIVGGFVSGAVNPQTLQGPRWRGSDVSIANKQTLVDVNLSGAFDLFGRTHEVLVGADMQDIKSTWNSYNTDMGSGVQLANVFDIASTPWVPNSLRRGELFRSYSPNDTRQYGAYGTLRLEVADHTRLIVGARANKYKYNQVYGTLLDANWSMTDTWHIAAATQYSEPTKVVPFGGIVYDINNAWTAYASYAEIFKPQANYKTGPAPGTGLAPMHGSTAELGVKGELLGGRLNTSLALYRTEQNDRAVLDTRYPTEDILYAGTCCYLSAGKVVSQGVDMEVNGEIARGVNVYAGYTYNQNRNKTENAVFSTITPKHSLKFFGTWQLPGAASAWKLGGGATVNSKQYVSGTAASWNAARQNWSGASVPFAYTQGGYAVWNLISEYRIDPHWTLTFNLNNVLDKKYYRTVGSSVSGNYYGEPRNWMVTLRGKF